MTTTVLFLDLATNDILSDTDLSTKWYYISLYIDEFNSSLFIDNHLKQTFENSLNTSNVHSDINITLGGDGFVGKISQFNIVSQRLFEEQIAEYSSCSSKSVSTDIVGWNEFVNSNLVYAYINIHSTCDDFDGCKTKPCLNGNCTDTLDGYLCNCPVGLRGRNCEINIDDCVAHACQNNATCTDEVNDYFCSCEEGFTGQLCEIAMVDGQWSEWDNWTECSVSCGNGTRQRQRSCSDPLPDNGGKYCNGSDTEVELCIRDTCRECPELIATENSTLSCSNTSGLIVCIHSCNEGYDFDHDVKSEYVCGNETYYYWDFQTEDNPYGRLPHCSEMTQSSKIHVQHNAFFEMESCDNRSENEVTSLLLEQIKTTVSLLPCVSSNTCQMDEYNVLNCNLQRRKRDTTTQNVGFSFKLSCDTTEFGTESCFYGLEDAIKEFLLLETNKTLNLLYENIVYYIIPNSTSSDSTLDCPLGSVPYNVYCVPCSVGRFYKDEECSSCPVGTYQDTIGQLSCKSCPSHLTTEGTNSISIDDCNIAVQLPDSKIDKNVFIIVGISISVPVITVAVVVISLLCRQNKHCKKPRKNKIITVQHAEKVQNNQKHSKHCYENRQKEFNRISLISIDGLSDQAVGLS